ncbi:MAG: hypothetical protein PHW76_09805 [Alphaproteobacteria bacterium]|nr:hypothetical protein [Alphaproteobacteria bacterium]
MKYTLGQAAKATGKSKSVIQRAILKGRISAQKDEYEQWNIEASELHRVFPLSVPETGNKNDAEQLNTGKITELEAQLKAVTEERDRLADEAKELKADRNAWREQASSLKLLAAPKEDLYAPILARLEEIMKDAAPVAASVPVEPPKGFWRRIVGG